ncbi:hypothetical protein Tco_0268143 [Tanacetum coccineum]
MDSMASYVCKSGMRRTKYARVLVDIEAKKGLKEEIELQYRDKDQVVKGTKKIKVEYDWQPPICSHCNVFRYNYEKCSKRIKTDEEIAKEAVEKSKKVKEAEFNVVQNKIKKNVRNTKYVRNFGGEGSRNWSKPDQGRSRIWKQKQHDEKKNSDNDKGKTKENTNKNFEEEYPPLRAQDKQSNNKEKVVKSNNRFSALRRINEDNPQDISMLKDKMLVDKYLNLKVQPSSSEIKNWSQEMIKYFKRACDADREKEKMIF